MQWLLMLVLISAVLALVFRYLPLGLSAALSLVAIGLTVGLTSLGGLERSIAPALLCAVGLGILVPMFPSPGIVANKTPKKRSERSKEVKSPPRTTQISKTRPTEVGAEEVDIPGYEVLEKVGSGGMASVFKAKRKNDGQIVALKVPMEQYVADAKFIRRFHREAEVALRLNHKNIVKTFEHGSQGVKHFMAMEYLDGRSLEDYIAKDELSFDVSVGVLNSVTHALQHIHDAGIVHRDIKPANIMVLKGGIRPGQNPVVLPDAVKLMDFGIAGGKMLAKLTMAGARLGTPVYMSPEQARGLKIDVRSDIYSLGLVAYEMLTGQTAFKGNYENIVHQQIFQMPPPPVTT
ncbi:MAG: serine/threonine-protein kinase [Deinococcales bacterium]